MPTLHKLKGIAERLKDAHEALGSTSGTLQFREAIESAKRAVETAIAHYRTDCANTALIVDTLNPIVNPLLSTQADVLRAGSTKTAEQLARAVTSLDLLLVQLTNE